MANIQFRRRFDADQPSTSVDLQQLKDQLSKLTDEGQGGFENFQAEIMATGVDDAVTERESLTISCAMESRISSSG